MKVMVSTSTQKSQPKKAGHPFKDRKTPYMLSDIMPELLTRVRLYAASKRIPIYRAFEHLLATGLQVIKENPAEYDIRIFPEEPQKPKPP